MLSLSVSELRLSHLKSMLSGKQLLRELSTLLVPLNALILKRKYLLLEVSNGLALVLKVKSKDVTNRVFGEENPTPCTIVIVPGSVSYHVQNSLQNNIISIHQTHSTSHIIYIRNNSVYEF
jgi:hypothetical protein